MLKEKFKNLCQNYIHKDKIIEELWCEIYRNYSHKRRYYHTLEHLSHIYNELNHLKIEKDKWNSIQFSIFYHDITYDVKKDDNEEQSALIANRRLYQLNIPEKVINSTNEIILLTKFHTDTENETHKFFLDADISILGSSPLLYQKYIENIRKEYDIYDNTTYNKGRIKILEHFMKKEKLFQSEQFYNKYEKQAQSNILNEYHQLQKITI